MKTATIREAQHHLSKLVDEVLQTGVGVVLTRRGKNVVKLLPIEAPSSDSSRLVNWNEAVCERNETLGDLPQLKRNPVLEMREEERY
jgi:prevent-host-death family protein